MFWITTKTELKLTSHKKESSKKEGDRAGAKAKERKSSKGGRQAGQGSRTGAWREGEMYTITTKLTTQHNNIIIIHQN